MLTLIKKIIFLLLLIYSNSLAQLIYPLAREVWSNPVKLFPDSLNIWPLYFSATSTSDTIIYCDQQIYYIYKDSVGEWVTPRIFNQEYGIPNLSPAYAVLTPDKKTLFFTDMWSTRMYRARYIDSTGEWGPRETFFDNGFNQTPRWYCMNFPNDTTMLVVGNEYLRKAKLRDGLWYPDNGFPEPGSSWLFDLGVWLNQKENRLYSGLTSGSQNYDLHVTFFYDSVISQETFRLNISKISDSLYQAGQYVGRKEHHPFLSTDRKRMIFLADYDGRLRYYSSRLLINERGDTVLTSVEEKKEAGRKTGSHILPNNPNPFSGETVVNFYLEKESLVTLKVYNSLGTEVYTITEEQYSSGFNSKRIGNLPSSGIYIIALQGRDIFLTNKITCIK